ncbi:MAG TPA: BatA domain-containing protein [candidate division Zixibacteria bacterium]|nr:BatA domain-containing protein [candidate division Zixibacteria bacterium]
MFSFLNSTVLFAAVAALIPLIIHLFSKRRVKVVEFSSLKHLKAMQRRQVRRLKIRQLLLLLLRMLIILAIVVAFARPTLQSGGVGSHASVSAVILLDNSGSMDRYVTDGNLFEIARQATGRVLETFGEADEVTLIPMAGGRDESLTPSSAALASERLEQIEIAYRPADLAATWEQASEILNNAANLNRELYLVTDRQQVNLTQEGLDSLTALDDDVRICMVDLPLESAGNLGVVGMDFGGQLLLPGRDFEINAEIQNYEGAGSTELMASLFLDGSRVAQQDVTVAGGERTPVKFTRSVSRTGLHSGYIELSDDIFAADNRCYFSFRIPEQFNVLVAGEDLSAQLIALALAPTPGLGQYWSIKQVAPGNLAGVNFSEYDMVILAGVPTLTSNYVDRIKAAVERGTGLFLTYGVGTNVERFNRDWSNITGVTIEEPAKTEVTRVGFYSLASVKSEHPIFTAFDSLDRKLPDLKFYSLPRVKAADYAETLMLFSGNRPGLVESRLGEGRVMTFTGPIDPAYSDIAGHAFFVPLVARVAEYLTARMSEFETDLKVGQRIVRAVDLHGQYELPPTMIAPDSSEYRLSVEENDGRLSVIPEPVNLPGVYRIVHMGREVDRFALNMVPSEGNLAAVDDDRLAGSLHIKKFHAVSPGATQAAITELRYGRELWQFFVWLALILMAAEMLLGRSSGAEEEA